MKRIHAFFLLFFVYILAGQLGLVFSPSAGYATLVAPVSGIAMAGLLLFGYRLWPSVWLGSSVLHFLIISDWSPLLGVSEKIAMAGSIGVGATIQALGGAYLIQKYVGFPNLLITGRDVSLSMVLGGPISCLVHASFGVVVLFGEGVITWESVFFNWLIWWVGETIGVLVILPIVSLAQFRKTDPRGHRLLAVGIPLCITYFLTMVAFLTVSHRVYERLRGEFEYKAVSVAESFQNNFARYTDLLRAQRSIFTTFPDIGRETFRQFVHDSLESHQGIQALEWIPRVEGGLRDHYERTAREDGYANFEITEKDLNGEFVRASPRSEHFPVFFVEPYKGNEAALGYDLASNPVRLEALEQARDKGTLVMSAPIVLVQETHPQPAVLMFYPIYTEQLAFKAIKDRRANLRGLVLLVLKINDIVRALPSHLDQSGLEWVLIDHHVSGEKGHLYSSMEPVGESVSNDGVQQPMVFHRDHTFSVGGRTWVFQFSQPFSYFFTHLPWDLFSVYGGGLLVCGFLGGLFLVLTGRKSLVDAQVKRQSYDLQRSETRFRLVFEASPSGMIMIDQQGNMILVNRHAETIFGYESGTLIGQTIECLVPERFRAQHPSNRDSFFNQPRARPMGTNQKLFGLRKDGSEFPIEIGLNPLTTEDGAFVLASVVDITARKKEEETLYKYMNDLHHSNQDLNDFAYIASHDLKEPLRGIHNYSKILLEDYGSQLDEEAKAKCDTLTKLSKRMEELIDSLLHFSRLGQTELVIAQMDLNQVVQDVLATLEIRLKECGVAVKIPRRLPTVTCDKARIGEIFRNLITNSMKYNDKSEKWIEIGFFHVGEDDGADQEEPSVFYVRDNGIGIREKHLGLVFRIFKRLNGRDKFGGGTGVGLTMTKKMVERHGGHMWVESIFGEGTTFYFTLKKGQAVGSDHPPLNKSVEPAILGKA